MQLVGFPPVALARNRIACGFVGIHPSVCKDEGNSWSKASLYTSFPKSRRTITCSLQNLGKLSSAILNRQLWTKNKISYFKYKPRSSQIRAEKTSLSASVCLDDITAGPAAETLKRQLLLSLEGIDRGIFGIQSAKKLEVEDLIEQLERQNPLHDPTTRLELVAGDWKLLYSSITILGGRRTKLGLREFVKLGDFRQSIDLASNSATNKVEFSVSGLGMLHGSLTIDASFEIASPTRVDIRFLKSDIVPHQLLNLFQKNYDLLLSIFNPEGWLEITYVDQTMRIGRDDKGNVFLVERL